MHAAVKHNSCTSVLHAVHARVGRRTSVSVMPPLCPLRNAFFVPLCNRRCSPCDSSTFISSATSAFAPSASAVASSAGCIAQPTPPRRQHQKNLNLVKSYGPPGKAALTDRERVSGFSCLLHSPCGNGQKGGISHVHAVSSGSVYGSGRPPTIG